MSHSFTMTLSVERSRNRRVKGPLLVSPGGIEWTQVDLATAKTARGQVHVLLECAVCGIAGSGLGIPSDLDSEISESIENVSKTDCGTFLASWVMEG